VLAVFGSSVCGKRRNG